MILSAVTSPEAKSFPPNFSLLLCPLGKHAPLSNKRILASWASAVYVFGCFSPQAAVLAQRHLPAKPSRNRKAQLSSRVPNYRPIQVPSDPTILSGENKWGGEAGKGGWRWLWVWGGWTHEGHSDCYWAGRMTAGAFSVRRIVGCGEWESNEVPCFTITVVLLTYRHLVS